MKITNLVDSTAMKNALKKMVKWKHYQFCPAIIKSHWTKKEEEKS